VESALTQLSYDYLWRPGQVELVEIAAQLGHDPALTLGTYAHLFEEFDLGSRPDPAEAIEEARREINVREMFADLDRGYSDVVRDPSSELQADARTRTADPFITRTPRRLPPVAVRGSEGPTQANVRHFAPVRFAVGAGWCVATLLPPVHRRMT